MDLLRAKKPTDDEIMHGVIADGLPDDARITAVHYEPRLHNFLIRVDSKEFDVVPEGETIPMLHARVSLLFGPMPETGKEVFIHMMKWEVAKP